MQSRLPHHRKHDQCLHNRRKQTNASNPINDYIGSNIDPLGKIKEELAVSWEVADKLRAIKVKFDEVAFICSHVAQPTLSINQVSLKAGDEEIKKMGWRQFCRMISIALLLLAIIFPSVLADVVINEVGLDAQVDYVLQWIELYNTGDTDVDKSSWSVVP